MNKIGFNFWEKNLYKVLSFGFFFLLLFYTKLYSAKMLENSSMLLSVSENREDILSIFGGKNYLENINSVSGNYCKIWFHKTEIDSVTSLDLDYAKFILSMADSAVEAFYNLGYDIPPKDKTIAQELGKNYLHGGDDLIDIYLIDLYKSSQKILALTNQDGALKVLNRYSKAISPSYVLIEDDYFLKNRDNELLRATVGHELFHAIQNGYLMFDNNMAYSQIHAFMEMSATAMEEVLYPEINDYINSVPYYFAEKQLTPFPCDINSKLISSYYGASSWVIYLIDLFGVDILRIIWDGISSGQEPLTVIENFFTTNNMKFSSFWEDYIQQVLYLPDSQSKLRDFFLYPSFDVYNIYYQSIKVSSINYSTTLFRTVQGLYYTISNDLWTFAKSEAKGNIRYSFFPASAIDVSVANIEVKEDSTIVFPSKEIFLYPNPINITQTKELILANNIFDEYNMKIYNIKGEKIDEQNLKSSKILLPKNLASGLYIIKITAEKNKIISLKFVVLK